MSSFVGKLNKNFEPDPNENVFASIWGEYEKVIMQSLITSSALYNFFSFCYIYV